MCRRRSIPLFVTFVLLQSSRYTAAVVAETFLEGIVCAAQRVITAFGAQNATLLQELKQVIPPLNRTPGIDEATLLAETVLPVDLREQLPAAAPNTLNFPLAQFWGTVDAAWTDIKQKGEETRSRLAETGALTNLRTAAQV